MHWVQRIEPAGTGGAVCTNVWQNVCFFCLMMQESRGRTNAVRKTQEKL